MYIILYVYNYTSIYIIIYIYKTAHTYKQQPYIHFHSLAPGSSMSRGQRAKNLNLISIWNQPL